MARILFLQKIWSENLGPMYLSSAVKSRGHRCGLIIEGGKPRNRDIRRFDPDIIAFSVTTGTHQWALQRAAELKNELGIPIIMGGAHATYYPEVIHHPALDIICRGEGERALIRLLDSLDKNAPIRDIPNLWIKTPDGIQKNDFDMLEQDLDQIPTPDRWLYYRYRFLRNNENKSFISGRGCPFSCTYCSIAGLRKLYEGKGTFVRFHSPERVVDDILQVKRDYGLNVVIFQDDTFILGVDRLEKLLELYARKVRIPFVCHIRADLVTSHIAALLKTAGCHSVDFGLESGNEALRTTVLGKSISNEQIRDSAEILRKSGIKFRTTNMFGLPGETLDQAFQTVRLNQEIKTDFPSASIYQPYPRTILGDQILSSRGLDSQSTIDSIGSSFFRTSLIASENKNEFINLQKLFWPAVRFPRLLPLIRRLIKLPPNPVFEFTFLSFYALNYALSEKVTLKRVINLGLHTAQTVFFGKH